MASLRTASSRAHASRCALTVAAKRSSPAAPASVSFAAGHFTALSQESAAVAAACSGDRPARRSLRTRASDGVVNAATAEEEEGSLSKNLTLGLYFAGWYAANIVFNLYNKQVLKVFPYPMTCTLLQFAVGAVLVSLFWITGIVKRPSVTTSQLVKILPLAVVHTIGNLSTNLSLGLVAVSFTHTIKAMEPFFSVVLSAIFLGDIPSFKLVLALFPIVGGVAIASFTEASFNWMGFGAAMFSNLTFQSRNVLSKKLMLVNDGPKMDNINLFSIITIMSLFVCAPLTMLNEGVKFTPAALDALAITGGASAMLNKALIAALCFHAYQQVSYMILERVTPVTHSVGNCVKRVIVIAASVLFFRNPVSMTNAIGSGVALLGVYIYGSVKRAETLAAKAKAA